MEKVSLTMLPICLSILSINHELAFAQVLMDSWYAAQKLMALIDNLGKIYYVPLKKNRFEILGSFEEAIAHSLQEQSPTLIMRYM